MNEVIPCCKNCLYSCGTGDRVYCMKNDMHKEAYDGCLLYEQKEVKCDDNSDTDK